MLSLINIVGFTPNLTLIIKLVLSYKHKGPFPN